MRICFACLVIVFGLAATVPQAVVLAQDSGDESPGELARDGIESLMRALGAFIDLIPQYEPPVLNENGDIIIRRKPKRERPPIQNPEKEETST